MSAIILVPRIKRLSSALANQIAAGEVIERPASVVKELLENCLDAGATRIVIDVSKAGSQLIRVTDNGHGIHPEDLQLALQRHATAKLNNHSDLAAISSLGFRGEALPSISSVAALTLTSRIAGEERAARVSMDAETGQSEFLTAAHAVGTTVEVRNLFYNTPARKKFLRSERTEYLHILEIVRRLALSRSDVDMELRHNGQKVLTCRAATTNVDVRVAGLLGRMFMSKAIPLDYCVGDMRVWGWLGVGDLARSTTDRQYLYLNGRMIRDQRLNHAIRLACEGQVASGRFPAYVLYLGMDLAAADVNVHPTKHEVRFRQARDVHDFFYAAVSTVLAEDGNMYASRRPATDAGEPPRMGAIEGPQHPQRRNIVGDVKASYGDIYARRRPDPTGNTSAFGQVIAQIQQCYILTQRGADSLLIDIEAATKHIVLTRLKTIASGGTITSRALLVPVSFTISGKQEKTLAYLAPLLETYAMHLQLAGPTSCMVRAIPTLLAYADIASLVDDLLNLNTSAIAKLDINTSLLGTMVKHAYDIPDPCMATEDMTNLLRQLANSGVDASLSRHAPVWTCLNVDNLGRLLSGNE